MVTEEQIQNKTYSANIVWGAAAAAFRINNGYVRFPSETQKANHVLMRHFANNPDRIEPKDYEFGTVVRDHYKNLLFDFIAGTLQDFLQQAHVASMIEEFSSTNASIGKTFSLIASMPFSFSEESKRKEARARLDDLTKSSKRVGAIGDNVTGSVTVVDTIYKRRYHSYAVNVITDEENVLFFFTYDKYEIGEQVKIMGLVKNHYGNTTQLDRVRRLTEQETTSAKG